MAHDLQLGAGPAEVRATAAGATDIDRARDAARRVRCCIGARRNQRGGHGIGQLRRFQLFADFGADAHQVRPCGLRVALAERQLHAHLDLVGHGDAAPPRVQPDDVAHDHVAAEVAGAAHRIAAIGVGPVHQPHQRGANGGQCFVRLVQRHPEIAQQHVERRFAIDLGHYIAVGAADAAQPGHRLATLCYARHQRDAGAERDAAQTPAEDPARGALAADVAVAAHRKLDRTGAAGREAAEQVTGGGAGRHFLDQLGQVFGGAVGVHQGGTGFKTRVQRRHAGEHAVLVGGQFAQHHGHRRLVEIFDVVGRQPDAHGAGPISDAGQLGAQMVQDLLRGAGVMVGDVEQRQRRDAGITVQGHLGAQLRQHQASGH